MAGYGSKPGERRGGRAKGTPNKLTVAGKTAVVEALNAGDGAVAFFIQLKEEEPKTFATICGRLIPHELTGPEGRDLIPPKDLNDPMEQLELSRRLLFALAKGLDEVDTTPVGQPPSECRETG